MIVVDEVSADGAGGSAARVGLKKLKPSSLEVAGLALLKLKLAKAGLASSVVVEEPGVPRRPELLVAEPKIEDFTGAGVEAGVVELGLTSSEGLVPSSMASMSVSLETGVCATGALDASLIAFPKSPPKKVFFGPSDDARSLSFADGSALKVEPSVKVPPPMSPVVFSPALFIGPPNGELVSIAEPAVGVAKADFDPNILPVEVGVAAAKPPFDANDENPPEIGAAGVEALAAFDPNTEVLPKAVL